MKPKGDGWQHAWIPATSQSAYLSPFAALNLPDPVYPDGGDWHRACWEVPLEGIREKARTIGVQKGPELEPMRKLLGTRELRDYRPSLRRIGHPAGKRQTPVWGPSHVRAVLEMAWSCTVEEANRQHELQAEDLAQAVDPQTVGRWLGEPMQWLKLQWWAWRIEAGPARAIGAGNAWKQWRRRLTPYADYREPDRTFEWWLYALCTVLAAASAAQRATTGSKRWKEAPE